MCLKSIEIFYKQWYNNFIKEWIKEWIKEYTTNKIMENLILLRPTAEYAEQIIECKKEYLAVNSSTDAVLIKF